MARKLSLRRLPGGGHGVFDGNTQVEGEIDHQYLMDYANGLRAALSEKTPSTFVQYGPPVDAEVIQKTREIMKKTGLSIGRARRQVFLSDPDLRRRYDAAHGSPPLGDEEKK